MSSLHPIDELTASLQKQNLKDINGKPSKLPSPAKRFEKELKKTGFTIFKPISDLGFYEWKPDLKDHSPFSEISVDEIKRQLKDKGKPPLLTKKVSIDKFPFEFPTLPPQMYESKYPLTHHEVAGIYVATKIRGLKLEDIDFVFGGSALSILANKNKDKKGYLATKIPGTSVGLVARGEDYEFNLSDPGHQFERIVTGKPIDERTEPSSAEHLQLMQVGDFKVLFIAAVDAMKDGEPIEVTCSNPYFWDIKACLQCVSKGSSVLLYGGKCRGSNMSCKGTIVPKGALIFITTKRLSDLYKKESAKLREAEGEIIRALKDMKQQLDDSTHSGDYELSFSTEGELSLVEQPGPSKLLPSPDVVDELLA